MKGLITKGINGFYYIKVEDSIIECKARGKIRATNKIPMVGDEVEIEVVNGKGSIEKIYERRNQLLRPSVSNVTQAFVVFSIKNPEINVELLNKFLVLCEYNRINIVIIFNKIDLIANYEENEAVKMVKDAGYEVFFITLNDENGMAEIRKKLEGNVSVFCGPSGVGKSTLLNSLAGVTLMETGVISERLKRGKHTTRHCELIEYNGGFIVDTPGFTSLESDFLEADELKDYIIEFDKYQGKCKYTGCAHHKEPNCAIKNAVDNGEINKKRYDFYIKQFEELKNRRRK